MATIRRTNVGDVLTIKKTAQIFGQNPDKRYLTNHSNHPESVYPAVSDPEYIIEVGTKLSVIDKEPAQTKYRQSYVTVMYNKHVFDIFASDLRRFCE